MFQKTIFERKNNFNKHSLCFRIFLENTKIMLIKVFPEKSHKTYKNCILIHCTLKHNLQN